MLVKAALLVPLHKVPVKGITAAKAKAGYICHKSNV
jgi:hypothetical protein